MKASATHIMQTPSFGLSLLGYAALLATVMKAPGADLMAFFTLSVVGAAVVTTIQDEVKSQKREWGWKGLISAMRRPSKDFLVRMTVHLPQMATAVAIALNWRAKRCRSTNTPAQNTTPSKSG